MKLVIRSFIESSLARIGQQAPGGSFVSAALRSLHPLEDIVPSSTHLAARAAPQLFGRQSAAVFESSSPGQGTFVSLGDMLCWILNLLPCVLCVHLGPRTHLAQRPASLSVSCFPCCAGGDSLPPPQRETQLCICCPPASPVPVFQGESLSQLTSSGGRKQACSLWCFSTNLSPTSLGTGPGLPLCMVSFFPMAAPAGLRPDIGITCLGSSLWHYSQGCQHTSLLPSFSVAKVFSLIDSCTPPSPP